MQEASVPITLASLAEALIPGRMRQIAHQAGEPYDRDLTYLIEERDAISNGIAGLRVRLLALLNGKFRRLFLAPTEGEPVLDWAAALRSPAITYVNLPVTAASEDVELFGRVVMQDLKQQCVLRMQQLQSGVPVPPTLLIVDEFAALREAEQIIDLLLQAREAALPTVVSTQYVPRTEEIRQAVLQAGLIVCHRVEARDAETIAAQFGTRPRWEASLQIDQLAGPTGMASAREQQTYSMHPNDLRQLARGFVAVRSVLRHEPSVVQVVPLEAPAMDEILSRLHPFRWLKAVHSRIHWK